MTQAAAPSIRLARLTGLGYLLIIACGLFAEIAVRSQVIAAGDPAATAANILASETLFRVGIVSDLIMLLADGAVAITLYLLLRHVSEALAIAAMAFRLLHTAITGANLLNMIYVLLILDGVNPPAGFEPSQLHALAMVPLRAHAFGYNIGLVFFGVHCLLLGWLLVRSDYFPSLLGILLSIAALGYLTDGFASILAPGYGSTTAMIIVFAPALIAELSFTIYLLIKGVRTPADSRGRGAGGSVTAQ